MSGFADIYIGRWYDYSYSYPFGDTLTLRTREGNLLIAATSLFVTVVGIRLWSIIAFALHQWRSQPKEAEVLFRQQQIILRNSSGPFGTFLGFLKLGWAWRESKANGHRVRNLKKSTLIISVLALLYASGFIALGILVTRVVRGDHVLLVNGNCGFYGVIGNIDYDVVSEEDMTRIQEARAYAQQCYQNHDSSSGCDFYPVDKIPYSMTETDCPFGNNDFGESFCKVPALKLETEMLDSDTHLGINDRPEGRLSLQRRHICAPLNISNYVVSLDDGVSWDLILGPNSGKRYTMRYNTSMLTTGTGISTSIQLEIANEWTRNSEYPSPDDFEPIAPLNLTDANVGLVFLVPNTVWWEHPVLDPWYSFTDKVDPAHTGMSEPRYMFDGLVSVLGCTDQARICNPVNSKCTEFMAPLLLDNKTLFRSLDINRAQDAVRYKTMYTLFDWSIVNIPYKLDTNALLAMKQISAGQTGRSLPDNQWKLEAEFWFQISLSLLQDRYIRFVSQESKFIGPAYVDLNSEEIMRDAPPVIDVVKDQCSMMRVRSSKDHQNFSFLGLMLIFAPGITIIVVSYLLEPATEFKRRKWGTKREYRETARLEERLLNLFARAHDHAGFEGWDSLDADVPVTAAGVKLGSLAKPRNMNEYQTSSKEFEAFVVLPSKESQVSISTVDTGHHTNHGWIASPHSSYTDISK